MCEPSSPDFDGTPDGIRAKRALLAHVRHELRTPINAILGYSEMLIEDAESDAARADLDKIHSGGRQALMVVNEVLDPQRLESLHNISLPEFEAKIRRMLHPLVDEIVRCCDKLIGPRPEEPGDGEVSDLHRIRKASHALLMCADGIVALWEAQSPERHEGRELWVGVRESGAPYPSDGTYAARHGGAGTLLVVDDNEANLNLLCRRLSRDGHKVFSAFGGPEALEVLKAGNIDIVLLDIVMPNMNGYELLKRMKGDEALSHIPVIMLSSLEDMETTVRCIETGAEDYLLKPYNTVFLRARIGISLERKRLRDSEVRLFRELQENYRRLMELEALRDSLTHMIIHDLRTPLTSILGGLKTLRLMSTGGGDERELIEIAVDSSEALLSMINDLLDINRMESGAPALDKGEFEVEALVEKALLQVSALAESKEISLSCNLAPELPSITVDGSKVVRTLVNLLGNAVKFTRRGGSIALAACRREEAMHFSVTDTGEGIPNEAFEYIFEKFGQVKTRSEGCKYSTGLGLTFCKMVVEAHGGRIWVESERGKGSTFHFTIPIGSPSK
jgi:signal transduction histidine kinase